MKKILLVLSILIGAVNAWAGTCEERLGNVFTANQRVQLCKSFGSSINSALVPSVTATYDLGSASLVWDDLYLDESIRFAATNGIILKLSAGGDMVVGGGIANSAASGSRAIVESKTAAGTGDLTLSTSDGANADAFIDLNGADSDMVVRNLSGTALFTLAQSGDGRFESGGTVAIQEATAGSACSGTLTATGATPVVTSTTCATTGSRIFLQRTSAETGTVNAWISAISNGVSFSATSEAADTGTYNWIIVHESP